MAADEVVFHIQLGVTRRVAGARDPLTIKAPHQNRVEALWEAPMCSDLDILYGGTDGPSFKGVFVPAARVASKLCGLEHTYP